MQKAGIVTLIKNRTDDMTLAIGDGNVVNINTHTLCSDNQNISHCYDLVCKS